MWRYFAVFIVYLAKILAISDNISMIRASLIDR